MFLIYNFAVLREKNKQNVSWFHVKCGLVSSAQSLIKIFDAAKFSPLRMLVIGDDGQIYGNYLRKS